MRPPGGAKCPPSAGANAAPGQLYCRSAMDCAAELGVRFSLGKLEFVGAEKRTR